MIKIDTGTNLIARYDDVIPQNVCNHIIEYLKYTIPENKFAKGFLPWQNNDNMPFVSIRDVEIRKIIDTYRFLFTQLVYRHYRQVVYPHFSDLVVWREGMKMDFHKDDGYEGRDQDQFRARKYSMVAYLNHDYEGGETVIKINGQPDYISVPKQGSVVIFKSNDECIHGVNEVTKGTRYTLPTWFATDITECETMMGFIEHNL